MTKTIKAWAVVNGDGVVSAPADNQMLVYVTAAGAKQIAYPDESVVRVTITIQQPERKKKL